MPRRAPSGPALRPVERLLFEVGIKLGGLFHQFIGVPVSSATAGGLARAIAAAVRLQPYVVRASVRIRPAAGGAAGRGRYGYRYLTAEMLSARVTVADGRARVTARLAYEPSLRYPMMRPIALTRRRQPRRRAPRSVVRRAARS